MVYDSQWTGMIFFWSGSNMGKLCMQGTRKIAEDSGPWKVFEKQFCTEHVDVSDGNWGNFIGVMQAMKHKIRHYLCDSI